MTSIIAPLIIACLVTTQYSLLYGQESQGVLELAEAERQWIIPDSSAEGCSGDCGFPDGCCTICRQASGQPYLTVGPGSCTEEPDSGIPWPGPGTSMACPKEKDDLIPPVREASRKLTALHSFFHQANGRAWAGIEAAEKAKSWINLNVLPLRYAESQGNAKATQIIAKYKSALPIIEEGVRLAEMVMHLCQLASNLHDQANSLLWSAYRASCTDPTQANKDVEAAHELMKDMANLRPEIIATGLRASIKAAAAKKIVDEADKMSLRG